ncbi:MAG: hypothetical protein QGH83_15225, partial [Candidatus Pacebacteria bacterium]|nr:hypothetical protein [Candidatus Paceibacterota bacterium]
QGDSTRNYHVATCILYSKNKGEKIFDDWSDWILSLKYETITHGDLGPNLFTKLIIDNKLEKYVLSKEYFCPVDWELYKDVLEHNFDSYGVHLYRSLWSRKDLEKLVNRYL